MRRRPLRTTGARPAEVARWLPGDGTPGITHVSTRARTIDVPPGALWPWLVQMGHRRAGWYALDRLERLVGAGDFVTGASADRVLPELQDLDVGDRIPLSDRVAFEVSAFTPPPAAPAVLTMALPEGGPLIWVWTFAVLPEGAGGSRLLVRTRIGAGRRVVAPLIAPLAAGHGAVELLQLARLRRRVLRRRVPEAGDDVVGDDGGQAR